MHVCSSMQLGRSLKFADGMIWIYPSIGCCAFGCRNGGIERGSVMIASTSCSWPIASRFPFFSARCNIVCGVLNPRAIRKRNAGIVSTVLLTECGRYRQKNCHSTKTRVELRRYAHTRISNYSTINRCAFHYQQRLSVNNPRHDTCIESKCRIEF